MDKSVYQNSVMKISVFVSFLGGAITARASLPTKDLEIMTTRIVCTRVADRMAAAQRLADRKFQRAKLIEHIQVD